MRKDKYWKDLHNNFKDWKVTTNVDARVINNKYIRTIQITINNKALETKDIENFKLKLTKTWLPYNWPILAAPKYVSEVWKIMQTKCYQLKPKA